jgi:ubiquinone/menaquinone biosynthesis C-methylase UbiE
MAQETQTKYMHGHGESVLRTHSWRTVANSAAFVIPLLKPDIKVLDVGCGPGTISLDMAQNYVKDGHVVSVDAAADVIEVAKTSAKEKGVSNIEFSVEDIYNLPYADSSFDLVFSHQVIQYLPDRPRALQELLRVTKPGGHVAVREADVDAFVFYPEDPRLEMFKEVSAKVALALGGEARAGRRLKSWAISAGFDECKLECSAATWCYSSRELVDWWADIWVDRLEKTRLRQSILDSKAATEEQLGDIVQAFKDWKTKPDAWFVALHGEIIYSK